MPVKYDKLFALMKERGINKRYLRTHGIHAAVVDKLIKSGTIDTTTIGKLCSLLNCQPGDIMEYVPDMQAVGEI
jgi:DNA-binding Xre family transcriptional regulator